ncbi:hypothetical protein QUF49_04845 [Fictibacillus sp. b24]|uniref:anti-sigma-I factor RsgI family protein n=1 Tax=Fictibacillus sp. b24 TaxID=3055863 RepID=UPI0025A2086A|nr:hypothetical protein [Fictibacillus sp. b24]MDM5315312.1 hypothetical protein [Fictibacillus sp. b24]
MKNGSGIVIEVQNKKATLLMKDGTFVSVRVPAGKRPLIGKEYQASYFSQRKRSLFVLPSISLSIAALVAFLFFSGFIPYTSKQAAAAYVSFDINPSLEVGVDEDMRVVEIDAFNNEAEHIIKKYEFSKDKSIPLEQFADQLIKAYESEGYMDDNQSMLITSVSDSSSDKKTKKELDKALNTIVKKAVVQYPVAITVTESNEDTRKKAKQLGVSSGKYTAFQKANENGRTYKEEKIKEVKFQELKVNTASSKDIKVVPHPRKIKSSQHEIKQKSDKPVLDQKKREHDHSHHNKKAQKDLVKAQKPIKIKADEKQVKKSKHNHISINKKQNEKRPETKNAVPKNGYESRNAGKPQKQNHKSDNKQQHKQQQKQQKNEHKH